ncbi:hypothetical protein NDU88_001210 [Pleurodeles waltl]|uniref:Uncharacterized protein n=1 Tax=Pleurodeles waltl TaxID=8319 RepID=A0AAV7U9H5_PLEWA|nr:hypothetical protein NDU88_001210 [Pleurodeles waltl]
MHVRPPARASPQWPGPRRGAPQLQPRPAVTEAGRGFPGCRAGGRGGGAREHVAGAGSEHVTMPCQPAVATFRPPRDGRHVTPGGARRCMPQCDPTLQQPCLREGEGL